MRQPFPAENPTVLLRLSGVLSRFPVSRAHFYAGIKAGKYPKPIRLSDGIVVWNAAEIEALCRSVLQGAEVSK